MLTTLKPKTLNLKVPLKKKGDMPGKAMKQGKKMGHWKDG